VAAVTSVPPPPDRISVLFVDDEPALLRAIERSVQDPLLEVLVAGGAKEALAILAARRVDVLVSDLDMPQMNGLELVKVVRREHPQTLRMILTGYTTIERALTAINEGEILRFFTKPFDLKLFRATILGLAQRIQREREEGEVAARRARAIELHAWIERSFPGATSIDRDERGRVVVDVDRLDGVLTEGAGPDLAELLERR
jgi:two-component system, probable response regulator PhcQ